MGFTASRLSVETTLEVAGDEVTGSRSHWAVSCWESGSILQGSITYVPLLPIFFPRHLLLATAFTYLPSRRGEGQRVKNGNHDQRYEEMETEFTVTGNAGLETS